jgi:hypothetical protein
MRTSMKAYYRDRAGEYDLFYADPRLGRDVARLKSWLRRQVRGRSVFEVAAGTGYWTEVAAPVARSIVASDCHREMLDVAAGRRLGPRVAWLVADAFALPELSPRFEVGMAHLWWSHVDKRRRREFLTHLASRLCGDATVLMIDQVYIEGLSIPETRRDAVGNRYEKRTLSSGCCYEIIKNYPSDEELRQALSGTFHKIEVTRLQYFWALRARM